MPTTTMRRQNWRPAAMCGLLIGLATSTAMAQRFPILRAAEQGAIRILRADPPAPSEPPDLLFLTDGRTIEAWDLSLSGTVAAFRLRDRQGNWFRESIVKSTIASIQIGRTLRDHRDEQARQNAPEPLRVTAAAEQPIRKREILAGKFLARQGRYTRWSFTFTSELNKYYTFAENATEYGQFMLRSHHRRPVDGRRAHENEVVAKGKYFLFAPGAVGNDDWVLNLSSVVYIENDISPRMTYFSDRLPDEVLIVDLSSNGKVLELRWADHAGWQWTSPVQQTYYRIGEPVDTMSSATTTSRSRTVSLLPQGMRAAMLGGRRRLHRK